MERAKVLQLRLVQVTYHIRSTVETTILPTQITHVSNWKLYVASADILGDGIADIRIRMGRCLDDRAL